MSANIVEEIERLYSLGGALNYSGERVSQLQHGLQCATFAEAAGESDALITACLLHDLGHLVHSFGEDAHERGLDDTHENLGAQFLSKNFGPEVTEPIRLHVAAKRYLCLVDKSYWDALSPISKRTLELQGGVFSEAEAHDFIEQPYATDAVKLRQWDDQAKLVGAATPYLAHFLERVPALTSHLR